jgi:hypothetical protein
VRGDEQCEPGEAEQPGEDNVGEPVVAEEDPAKTHGARPAGGQDDAQADAQAAGEPDGEEIGDQASDDGAVQRVTRRKGKGVLTWSRAGRSRLEIPSFSATAS